ncbi:unnamed protein product [Clonostachys rosea f. rosea IK726]|uniref:Uncharacterized protein n=1 Tax=Clonostachys rosea f. rosea IK726 TaxID=1349383 RepID=A0ACA9UHM7_BIOOC|nr:unnamed protein product [Clonostachys rosea f. rosea IK726]
MILKFRGYGGEHPKLSCRGEALRLHSGPKILRRGSWVGGLPRQIEGALGAEIVQLPIVYHGKPPDEAGQLGQGIVIMLVALCLAFRLAPVAAQFNVLVTR